MPPTDESVPESAPAPSPWRLSDGVAGVLPVAAVVIVALVVYKLKQPPQVITPEQRLAVAQQRRAPTFSLYDSHNHITRLQRSIGREKILLIFFDGEAGCDRDPQLQLIREHYADFKRQGVVFGISTVTPWRNREAQKRGGEYPFPLLSDADYSVQAEWECLQGDPPRTIPSAFVIDRLGIVRYSHIGGDWPVPVATLLQQLRQAR